MPRGDAVVRAGEAVGWASLQADLIAPAAPGAADGEGVPAQAEPAAAAEAPADGANGDAGGWSAPGPVTITLAFERQPSPGAEGEARWMITGFHASRAALAAG